MAPSLSLQAYSTALICLCLYVSAYMSLLICLCLYVSAYMSLLICLCLYVLLTRLAIAAAGLVDNASLTKVDLSWNGFGDMGALGVVCDALSFGNTTLTELNLAHNRITGSGATVLAAALRSNTSLIKLKLDSNPVGVAGAKELVNLTLPVEEEELARFDPRNPKPSALRPQR
jgi:hypothetical protein